MQLHNHVMFYTTTNLLTDWGLLVLSEYELIHQVEFLQLLKKLKK
jgi:hypothetical protein